MKERIGVVGGTFNPIHVAHVRVAQEYQARLQLDRLIFVPTYIPPHKDAKNLANANDRLQMCCLAIQGLEGFSVCDYEILQRGKSYTYKTLQHLHTQHPAGELYLIMGADMFLTVQDWKQPETIYRLATLCAVERENGELARLKTQKEHLEQAGARCILLDMEPLSLSSTRIRSRIKSGDSVEGLLHPDVQRYIQCRNLYK